MEENKPKQDHHELRMACRDLEAKLDELLAQRKKPQVTAPVEPRQELLSMINQALDEALDRMNRIRTRQ